MNLWSAFQRIFGTKRSSAPVGYNHVELLIPKMHCEGCAEKITDLLSKIGGISSIKTKVPNKKIHIYYDADIINENEIKNTLAQAGFAPSV